MMGPLGLLAPHPGVSYLFSGAEALPKDDIKDEGSLWGIAHAHAPQSAMGPGGGYANTGGMNSPPPSWTPALAEMVLKVDGKFKVGLYYYCFPRVFLTAICGRRK
jgi:hypothetical protein